MYSILKKKFGQNFLIDKNIILKIVDLISKKNLNIIEIGPGDGRLTEFILKYDPIFLKLIEIDPALIPILNSKFSKEKNIKIVNKNILEYKFDEKIDLIISNLPYNISSQILSNICLIKSPPNKLILMFQKEFAERLIDKKRNSLNSLVECFYDIKLSFKVSKKCFRPIPKVDSAVLVFTKKEKALINKNEINNFIEFKRNLFSHKRKSLSYSLKKFDLNENEFNLKERVENLSLSELLDIFRKVNL